MPTSASSPSNVHVSAPLTNFSMKFLQDQSNFIAMTALPNNPVSKQYDKYYEFNLADFKRNNAKKRAPATESAGAGFDIDTKPYQCDVWALHKDISDQDLANQDSQVNLFQSSTQFITEQLLIAREINFASKFMGAGVWETEDATLAWGDDANNPIKQIRDKKRAVQLLNGYRPNKMAMSRDAYDTLLDHPLVLDRIIGGSTVNVPALIMRQKLAELLELESISVTDAVYNTQAKNKTDPTAKTMSFASSGDALLYYAPNTVGLDTPTAGVQMSWTGYVGATSSGSAISRWYDQDRKAWRVEGEMAFDYRVTAPELGVYLSNLTAS